MFLLAMSSCGERKAYHAFRSLPSDGWGRSETMEFALSSHQLEAGKQYALQVELCYTSQISYRSLWLIVSQNLQDSTRMATDTVECVLVNEQRHLIGSGPSGYCQATYPVRNLTCHAGSSPAVRVSHFMKQGRIAGIRRIGIRLTEEP